jgi:anti-anti-sigma factor
MDRPMNQIEVERHGDVCCIRLRKPELEEEDLHQFSSDVNQLIQEEGCRKLVLCLGPDGPMCLYSIFLAKLVSIQRRLNQAGGVFKLAHVSPEIFKIFEACRLQTLFEFCPDQKTALADFAKS